MKKNTQAVCYLLMLLCLYSSCKKADSTMQEPKDNSIKNPTAAIFSTKVNNAKNFFIENIISKGSVTTNLEPRQKIGKSAQWEKAYIAHSRDKGEIVIVPLKYDKQLQMITSFGNGEKVSIEAQSNLWVYKDKFNNYVAEVVTVLPDKAYLEGNRKRFSGYILEEDWNGNNIRTLYSKDGKTWIRKKGDRQSESSTGTAARIVCDAINWYLCDVDNYGNLSNCVYQFTEILDCYDDGPHEVEDDLDPETGGGGGFTEDVNGIEVSVIKLWDVSTTAYANIFSADPVKGFRTFSSTSTTYNYFTSISHGSSYLNNLLYFDEPGNNHTLIHDAAYGYSESASSTTFSKTSVSSNVSGHYTQQDLQPNTSIPGTFTAIPTGQPYTVTKSGSRTWSFFDVFP